LFIDLDDGSEIRIPNNAWACLKIEFEDCYEKGHRCDDSNGWQGFGDGEKEKKEEKKETT
jgi:hypothetical protein